jgi:tetratricopeptide (TPR) repeat protein
MHLQPENSKQRRFKFLRNFPKQFRLSLFKIAAILVVILFIGAAIIQVLPSREASTTPENLTAEEVFTLGLESYNLGDYAQAIEYFNTAIAKKPSMAAAYAYLGQIYYESQRIEQAETLLNQALNLDSKLADAYYYRGLILAQRDEIQQAAANLHEAITLGYQSADAYYQLGKAYQSLGHTRLCL